MEAAAAEEQAQRAGLAMAEEKEQLLDLLTKTDMEATTLRREATTLQAEVGCRTRTRIYYQYLIISVFSNECLLGHMGTHVAISNQSYHWPRGPNLAKLGGQTWVAKHPYSTALYLTLLHFTVLSVLCCTLPYSTATYRNFRSLPFSTAIFRTLLHFTVLYQTLLHITIRVCIKGLEIRKVRTSAGAVCYEYGTRQWSIDKHNKPEYAP
jgi:hypothetical protein